MTIIDEASTRALVERMIKRGLCTRPDDVKRSNYWILKTRRDMERREQEQNNQQQGRAE